MGWNFIPLSLVAQHELTESNKYHYTQQQFQALQNAQDVKVSMPLTYLELDEHKLAVRGSRAALLKAERHAPTDHGAWAWTPTSLSLPFLLRKWDNNNVIFK